MSDAGGAQDAGTDLATSPVNCAMFSVSGDPRATGGARWTYQSTDGSDSYNLEGVLFTPAGAGPFPAAVVSHGKGGLPTGYSASVGRTMVGWGMVIIATRYTHAADPDGRNAALLPAGADGASAANVARAKKTLQLLSCLSYVDSSRIAAHGHSMGAFVTGQVLGTYTTDFRAASHTAGGTSTGVNATKPDAAMRIVTPYQLHHGDMDTVVSVQQDRTLAAELMSRGVVHELHIYPGYTHEQMALDATMFDRVRTWYTTHGVLP